MAMASTLHPSPRRSSTTPVVATTNDGDLPLDLLYEILLRLPFEPICRFRAVCRSWRSLLCHPDFIATARNPGPLLAIGLMDSTGNHVHVLDMESGDAVKHVSIIATNNAFLSTSDDRVVCLVGAYNRLRLRDLVTGALSILPNHSPPLDCRSSSGIVGCVAPTGEMKVLAITTSYRHREPQVCKILNLGIDSFWRDTKSPPLKVMLHHQRVVVINGVAYFLSSCNQSKDRYTHPITVFDFKSEAWRPAASSLQGPANCRDIILAVLESHLVACHHADGHTSIDLWFLVDLDRSLWTKRYTIPKACCRNPRPLLYKEYFEKPLAVLDDGRIVMWMRVVWSSQYQPQDAVLRIYNPITKTFKDGTRVSKYCSHFTVFTWSLLHSGQRSPLDTAAKSLLLRRRRKNQCGATLSREGPNKKPRISEII